MKILIIKIAAIGDVIMATTMLSAIKEKYGDCEITWVCGECVYSILRCYPIKKLIPIDESKLLRGNTIVKIKSILSLWGKLIGKSYDLIVTAHSDKRYALLSIPVKSKRKISFHCLDGQKIPIPGRYHGDEYARLITGDGNSSMKHWYPEVLPHFDDKPINSIHFPSKKIIVLAPGGAKNIMRDDGCRRWPVAQYVTLAERLISLGFVVAITGAASDRWVESYFSKVPVVDFIGKTNLIDTLHLFSQADIVITHDSGPLHLAVLVRATVIGIFGPTMPSEKVPNASTIHVLWNSTHLSCCPCYDGRNYANCRNNVCLKEITVENVLKKIAEIEGIAKI